MIYSRSAQYAIRALILLAQLPEGRFITVKTIGERENIPTYFLAKILQQLAHKRLLRSSTGLQGGFALNVPAEEIRLLDIVEALGGLAPFQPDAASMNDYPDGLYCCTMNEEWVDLQNVIQDYLKAITVADLAKSQEAKQRTLARRAKRRAAAFGLRS